MASTMVQDRHVRHGQLEQTLTPSKTPSKLQRQEHPELLLGVLDAAHREPIGFRSIRAPELLCIMLNCP